MTPEARATLDLLRENLRKAALAKLGGFRPPSDPVTSWFGKGVGEPGEGLPIYGGEPLFPLLQIRVSELPYVPSELEDTALLVLFFQTRDYPFGKPHGEGWLIREYSSLNELVPLPDLASLPLKPFPISWTLIEDDTPGWEDAGSIIDASAINADEQAVEAFFYDFNRYAQTKVGGYPRDIQYGVGIEEFVFQVGSEEKAKWMWVDNGIAYFFKSVTGEWCWECQFY